MSNLPATYNDVLADMRAHGQPCTNWVPWDELERGDQAFITHLMTFVAEQAEIHALEKVRDQLLAAFGLPAIQGCPTEYKSST